MSMLRRFIDLNVSLSRALDSVLPERVRLDGNKFFKSELAPSFITRGLRIYDLGGGSNPMIDPDQKRELDLFVVGLDISAEELAAAPEGSYDRTIAADLCTFKGRGDADLVICQATLEHVPDASGAMRAIAETLAPGGRAALFLPSRNAVFARINLILPQRLKERLLFSLFPHKATGHDGFEAYYDHCTPRQIATLARKNGLDVEACHLFWISSYFTIFTPAFILWRVWQGLSWLFMREQAAETFAVVLLKPKAG